MKKILKITGLVIAGLLILILGGFILWAETPARPQSAALAALQSDSAVTVLDQGEYILFYPAACKIQRTDAKTRPPIDAHPTIGFVFYPGGRVDYRAYAPALRQIAEQGYLVALVPVRLNLAFFDIDAASPVLADFPEIEKWVVGGHSLGGVAASIFAADQPQVGGLVYWASYPADDSLKDSGLPMLSVYGTQDGLATGDSLAAARVNMPANALFVPIEGGNHAQFGDYGLQSGDNPATIPAEAQWQLAAQATVDFLKSLNP